MSENYRLRRVWLNMLDRCCNEKHQSYADYGGRGITVCSAWRGESGWLAFERWALCSGYRDDLTLDRRDNDGPYSPDNCRWATAQEQAQNRRTCRIETINGETYCLAEWNRRLGLSPNAIYDAARRGIPSGMYIMHKLHERKFRNAND